MKRLIPILLTCLCLTACKNIQTSQKHSNMNTKITENFGDLSKIDIIYALATENSAVLMLITVGHINGDPQTQTDLLDKLEGYLIHIQSPEFKTEYPQQKIFIDVVFEEKPDVLITDLLYKCMSWCEENGATLRIQIEDKYVHFAI